MSLAACIPGLLASGQLTPQQAQQANKIYGARLLHNQRTMGAGAAAALASQQAVQALQHAAALARRQTLLQIEAQKRMIVDMARYDGGSGKRPGNAAKALFDHDGRAPYSNVEGRLKVIKGRAHAMMDGILAAHSRDLLGRMRNPAQMLDIVREAFGHQTGNVNAAHLARAWMDTADMLRQRFNAAGGAIGVLADWGLPQSHDSGAVRLAGLDTWRDFIWPLLDRGRMVDQNTGLPFTDADLRTTLADVFDTIRSEGWIDRNPGTQGGSKLANQRAEQRFLIFNSPDSWLQYRERFGHGTAFDAMMGHIDGMARDIAHMEILGPNPGASVKWLQDSLMKGAAIGADPTGREITRAQSAANRVQELYDATSGKLSTPVNAPVARAFGTVRSLNVASLLGSAMLSATTDMGFQAVTRAYNGLPVVGALTGYLKLMNPLAHADRRAAVRLGLIAEESSKIMASQNRYLGESLSHEWAQRLADTVMRISLLSPWTQAGRWAYGMETLGRLADNAGKSITQLDPAMQSMLGRYGIDGAAWDHIRSSTPYQHKGAIFLRPEDVADPKLGDRLLELVQTETEYAVPATSARVRSILSLGQPGTLKGEFARNVALFKSFGVSMLLTHGLRMMEGTPGQRARYAAGLVVSTTLLGALAMQLKSLAAGKDPEQMTGDKASSFWGRAVLQGGGFGIFGDFVGSAASDRVGSLGDAIAGPVAGNAADLGRITVGNIAKAATGERTHVGRDAVKLVQRYTPGSSLWYTRLGFNRLVLDQLQREADPDYEDSWLGMERRAHTERGQDFWWAPGQTAPERAPDFSNALAAEETVQ